MNLTIWIFVSLTVLLAAAPITQGGLRPINDKQLGKLLGPVGLPMPPQLRLPLGKRIAGRERWAVIGGSIGVVVAVIIAIPSGWAGTGGGLLVMILVAVGVSLGGVVGILTGRQDFNRDAPRTARARQTTLANYVPRPQLRALRVAPLIAVVAWLATGRLVRLLPRQTAETPTWAALALVALTSVIVLWIVSELLARIVVKHPQRAGSDLELAWDDVFRGQALSMMFLPVSILAAFSVVFSGFVVSATIIEPEVRADAIELTLVLGFVTAAVCTVCVLVLLVLTILGLARPTAAHVARRLWAGAVTADRR